MNRLIKFLIACVFVFTSGILFAQNTIQEPAQSPTAQYRLFRTTNIWTFIKLDTMTGKIWQVQYDLNGDNRGSVVLNSQDLASGKTKTPGRFTLYPTSNIWTFILLDQIDGSMWQIQWSNDIQNRLVLPID